MKPIRIFISSVQKEFAGERAALRDYLRGDALLRRFFEPFLFEDVPAADRRADDLYLDETERCDIYLGLFGTEYGVQDEQGVSPTQREFELASERRKHRLIFVKGTAGQARHAKMEALIQQAGDQLIRRRFGSNAELIAGVYAALVQYLEAHQLIRNGPFDASPCLDATVADLDTEKMAWFLREARQARAFPLPEGTGPQELLAHLNLLHAGKPTHAAVLLFGEKPQRFLISSEIKCAHFHGTKVAKPIPSYQVYKGTVFDLVDDAVDFVLSKINLAVGTRQESVQVPVAYEIPPEVVREAIVNAVAHRDYTSNGSVQVMLFADRLEVWNPGTLLPPLTLEKLRQPHGSVPGNPLLAEALYLAKYIERMGTGIEDMIERCHAAGLAEPRFALTDGFVSTIYRKPEVAFASVGGSSTPAEIARPSATQPVTGEVAGEVAGDVTGEVRKLLLVCRGAMSRQELQATLALKGADNFRKLYLMPALDRGLLEMTIPDKPKSRMQKYRLTKRGAALLAALKNS